MKLSTYEKRLTLKALFMLSKHTADLNNDIVLNNPDADCSPIVSELLALLALQDKIIEED